MPAAIILTAYALAVARVTRLLTTDKIFERPRDAVLARLWARYAPAVPVFDREKADPPLAVYLATCPWCISIYVGAVAAPLWYWLGAKPWLLVPAVALAFSQVTGLLAQVGD